MKLEASPIGDTNAGMQQIHSQLTNLTLQLQDMKKSEEVCDEVWCTKSKVEGHSKKKCPIFINYIVSGAPNPLNDGSNLWCDICRTRGEHHFEDFYLL